MRMFSFGGGVQSHAVLCMQANGEVNYDEFVFANVGDDSENPKTIEYIKNYTIPFCEKHGIKFTQLENTKTLYSYASDISNKAIPLPVYLRSGAPANRDCTWRWKIKRIDSYCKKKGIKFTQESPLIVGLGISVDEWQRARIAKDIWKKNEYPLINYNLNRNDCLNIINKANLPQPPKSSCWFCPYTKLPEWRRMLAENPEQFKKACELEKIINEKRGFINQRILHLTPKKVNLELLIEQQYEFDFDDENCESGYCMV